jgi:hypothetical protein
VVNAKKIKGHNSTGKKVKKGDNLNAINLLTGAGYGKDDNRNIPCLVDDCPYLFIRKYDLEVHLQSKHGVSSSDIENGAGGLLSESQVYGEPNDRSTLDDMYDQAGLEWEMQRTAMDDNAPFWIGGGDEDDPGAVDSWSREEEEMRRLIDPNMDFDRFVDPLLRDL